MRDRLIELIDEAINDESTSYSNIADYLLENGVIVLPCNVGDKIYDISEFVNETPHPEMYEYKADYITLYKKYPERDEIAIDIDGGEYKFDDFGKIVFLTKEEAAKALKGGADNA